MKPKSFQVILYKPANSYTVIWDIIGTKMIGFYNLTSDLSNEAHQNALFHLLQDSDYQLLSPLALI